MLNVELFVDSRNVTNQTNVPSKRVHKKYLLSYSSLKTMHAISTFYILATLSDCFNKLEKYTLNC